MIQNIFLIEIFYNAPTVTFLNEDSTNNYKKLLVIF